jgi:hypothetical protein
MAHYAQIDSNNIVTQVIVIDNKDTADANGTEKEYIGAAYCERLFGGTWKQTSYNATIRKNYAGIGYKYQSDIDAFVPPQPYASWTLDANAKWQPPTPMPTGSGMYNWDEATLAWLEVTSA